MAGRSISWAPLLLGILIAATPGTRAEEQWHRAPSRTERAADLAPGIRTNRLSAKQLRVWNAIEAIVLSKDGSGLFKHSRLHSLLRWVETSGHVVQVELPDPKARGDHQAGRFMIETHDPNGQKHIAVVRLCLHVIDGALVRKRIPGADGFVRFEGLGKEERYAEILGHELAHAVWTLGDQSHARLTEDLKREVEEFERWRRQALHGATWDERTWQHLRRIQAVTAEIERPAEMAESVVWKELRRSRGEREESAALTPAERGAKKTLDAMLIPGESRSSF